MKRYCIDICYKVRMKCEDTLQITNETRQLLFILMQLALPARYTNEIIILIIVYIIILLMQWANKG